MKKHRFLFIALIVVLGVLPLLAACGTPEATEAPKATEPATKAPEATEDPRMGGKLIFASSTDEIRLDPNTTTWNTDIMISFNIYETLYRVNRDGTGLEPSAAESYDVSDDLKVWTFYLRKGLKFSDGTPLTAEDVAFSIERGLAEDSLWAWIWQDAGLEKAEAIDDYTVVFTLNKPFVPFLTYQAGYWASIFPKAALEAQGDEAFFEKPVCSGPYMVKEFVQADHLTIVRNPHSRLTPFIDEIEFPILPDDNTRMLKLQAGEIDVAWDVPPSQIDAINALPGLMVKEYPFAATGIMFINHAKPPLDDVNFRLALNYAVDREALIETVLFGHGEFPTSFLPPGVMYWNDTVPGYPYDLEKAKEYLAMSKYADGAEFEIWTSTTGTTDSEIATALQDMWSKLPGVETKIVQHEPAVSRELRAKGEHWMFTGYFSSDVVDPDELTSIFIGGYWNGFVNADISEIEPVARQAQIEADQVKRGELYSEIQQWAQENAMIINLYYGTNNWGMKETVRDLWANPLLGTRLHEAWIEKQ
ncbi:MAG: ABC transporter substrate-binding protein [Chloroflexota bacterium]|nr:ABC transporter substrate-binding protein [Chloroflexota bacterium]